MRVLSFFPSSCIHLHASVTGSSIHSHLGALIPLPPPFSCFQHLLTPVPGWAHRMQGQGAESGRAWPSQGLLVLVGDAPQEGDRGPGLSLISQEKHCPGSQRAEEGEGWGNQRVSLALPPVWECLCALEAVSVILGVTGDLSVCFPLCCLDFCLLPCSAPLSLTLSGCLSPGVCLDSLFSESALFLLEVLF